MPLYLLSFLAGLLTLAAPCVMTLLPVIVGGSLVTVEEQPSFWSRWRRPLVVIGSLIGSVVLFSILLKGTTALLGVPQEVWQWISGGLIVALGIHQLFPDFWKQVMLVSGLGNRASVALATSGQQRTVTGEILTGVALGPVFTSCSPTYALIVAAILPVSFTQGFIHITLYALGLAVGLFAITLLGHTLIGRLGWLRNPYGWFARAIGILFLLVGVAIMFGWDKQFQSLILDQSWFQNFLEFETQLKNSDVTEPSASLSLNQLDA